MGLVHGFHSRLQHAAALAWSAAQPAGIRKIVVGMQAVYFRDSSGAEPVNEFIDRLPPERQEEIDYKISLLNRLASGDPPLPFPHSSQVDGPLRELRCHYGRDLYRILYQRSGNLFILLHAIEKRSGALPRTDIEVAKARFADFRTRMNDQPRRPPRPAGHDAP